MSIRKKPMKVFRFWNRIADLPAVRDLSHPSRWWLYGLVMEWTGYNNGVIEFTRRRHASRYGLEHPEVFVRARREVMSTGLIMMTRPGGHGIAAQYAIVNLPIQAMPSKQELGTPDVPSHSEINGTPDVPSPPKTWYAPVTNLVRETYQVSEPHIMIARASDYGNEKTDAADDDETNSHTPRFANQEAYEEGGSTPYPAPGVDQCIGEISKALEKAPRGGRGGTSKVPTDGKYAKAQTLKEAGISTTAVAGPNAFPVESNPTLLDFAEPVKT